MTDNKCVEVAREEYQCDDIEIENDAKVSRTAGGAWVGAWVWIKDAEDLRSPRPGEDV